MSNENTLQECLIKLFTPVLRLCLKHSVKLQQVYEFIKLALVRIAVQELKAKSEKISVSKVTLMTGIHRKDVTALLQNHAPRKTTAVIFSKIIGQWLNDKRFMLENSAKQISCVGANSEFANLVKSVNRELNPYSFLFEMERMGTIEVKDGYAKLLRVEYTPSKNIEEGFTLIANDIEDLIRAAEENLTTQQEIQNLHLSTAYDNIVAEALPEIRAWFMDQGAEIHKNAREFLSKFDKDLNPELEDKEAGYRVALGAYSFTEKFEGKN